MVQSGCWNCTMTRQSRQQEGTWAKGLVPSPLTILPSWSTQHFQPTPCPELKSHGYTEPRGVWERFGFAFWTEVGIWGQTVGSPCHKNVLSPPFPCIPPSPTQTHSSSAKITAVNNALYNPLANSFVYTHMVFFYILIFLYTLQITFYIFITYFGSQTECIDLDRSASSNIQSSEGRHCVYGAHLCALPVVDNEKIQQHGVSFYGVYHNLVNSFFPPTPKITTPPPKKQLCFDALRTLDS